MKLLTAQDNLRHRDKVKIIDGLNQCANYHNFEWRYIENSYYVMYGLEDWMFTDYSGSYYKHFGGKAFKSFKEFYKWAMDTSLSKIFYHTWLVERGCNMLQVIIDHFPKTKEAVLVDKWFGQELAENKLSIMLLKGKEKNIIAEAIRLEEEEKKNAKKNC